MNLSPVLWLAVVFVLSSPRLALAGGANDPDDGCLRDAVCRGHYDKAMKSYGAGRYEAALPEFQSAYGLRQMPWLLVNIGRSHHKPGTPILISIKILQVDFFSCRPKLHPSVFAGIKLHQTILK